MHVNDDGIILYGDDDPPEPAPEGGVIYGSDDYEQQAEKLRVEAFRKEQEERFGPNAIILPD
jgi:hypothetical protein